VRSALGGVVFFVAAVVVVLPTLLVRGCELAPAPLRRPAAPLPGPTVSVYWDEGDETIELPLEEYVAGVVAAEMPAAFHIEALKAQAVAARTYAARRMRIFGGGGSDVDPDADVTSDPRRDQAWLPWDELRRRWGFFGFFKYRRKILQAVGDTKGLVLTYEGFLADPVYHSTSGGRTEDARVVWGVEVPYLVSVPSEHESHSPRFSNEVEMGLDVMAARLGIEPEEMEAHPRDEPLLEVVRRTPGGRVAELRVCGRTFRGTEVRLKLGLDSTWFDWEIEGGTITFRTRGYGHGVGMSQYGADGMAENGSTFDEILYHYYPGTRLTGLFAE